jgi:hypothetical protein
MSLISPLCSLCPSSEYPNSKLNVGMKYKFTTIGWVYCWICMLGANTYTFTLDGNPLTF